MVRLTKLKLKPPPEPRPFPAFSVRQLCSPPPSRGIGSWPWMPPTHDGAALPRHHVDECAVGVTLFHCLLRYLHSYHSYHCFALLLLVSPAVDDASDYVRPTAPLPRPAPIPFRIAICPTARTRISAPSAGRGRDGSANAGRGPRPTGCAWRA